MSPFDDARPGVEPLQHLPLAGTDGLRERTSCPLAIIFSVAIERHVEPKNVLNLLHDYVPAY
jgi:hypothetical protein